MLVTPNVLLRLLKVLYRTALLQSEKPLSMKTYRYLLFVAGTMALDIVLRNVGSIISGSGKSGIFWFRNSSVIF